VCFPHAGGAASWYAPLARLLAPAVDVVAVQYPGRQDRLSEPCLDSITALRDAVVAQLLAAPGWLDRPVALFGHSMGAVVAYEVARTLEHDHGRPPRALFVSGRRAPSTHRVEQVHLGGDAALLREVARLGGTPPELLDDPDVHDLVLPALRGDYRAIETYAWRPGPEPGGPLWALVGDDDPVTTPAEAAAWRPHTSGLFERRVFPGRHFYLADPGPAAEVAALVRTALG
jgi:surfactin synthase thioesterase subunit